ncbi:MAG: ATP-dependent DNA helicase, partial [Planctomycetes bacterium]|nr:ATP-dependent DNA helicase [Planctomycetota bacterium]
RKGARLTALTNGGAIPENADYRVELEPEGTFVGTLNEDFAIESMAGDIFQLGNTSWQIVRVTNGVVRVQDAKGQPPSIPFWLGEAPSRTTELSGVVSSLREATNEHLGGGGDATSLAALLQSWPGVPEAAAIQAAAFLEATHRALGIVPTQHDLVFERFFDEAGGMQLVIHSPYGGRLNRAWGLALRKRFCRSFNFELQAAATEDAIILSLGETHSFALDEVPRYLNAQTARDVLVQALLDAPMFQTRWRWVTNRALAVPRRRGGKKVPANIQRMQADDLVAVVFPDQLACLENIQGDREIPDHPLVRQTIDDCLVEAMDIDGLEALLGGIENKSVRCHARDLPEPSVASAAILNAMPYAFLDDAPLEERRARAVYTRRGLDAEAARALGALDAHAIEQVRVEAWPTAENEDEVHDALMQCGVMRAHEVEPFASQMAALRNAGRATALDVGSDALFVATERVPEARAAYAPASLSPEVRVPERYSSRTWSREEAIVEIVRSRLEVTGVTTRDALARTLALSADAIARALTMLEGEGFVLRGHFSGDASGEEWCERRLLARIHRLTIGKLRAEIEP